MSMKKYLIHGAVLLAAAACSSGVKESLGIKRSVPDEFRVISRPPLSVPPNFTLRPPLEGDAVQASSVREEARQSLLEAEGETTAVPTPQVTTSEPVSSGERRFLNNIGAEKANQNIKQVLREENQQSQEKKEKTGVWDKVLQKDKETNAPDPVVDAAKESERIKGNIKENKPVTEGETPTKKAGKQNILQRIFSSQGEE